jgi:hypothetical protein
MPSMQNPAAGAVTLREGVPSGAQNVVTMYKKGEVRLLCAAHGSLTEKNLFYWYQGLTMLPACLWCWEMLHRTAEAISAAPERDQCAGSEACTHSAAGDKAFCKGCGKRFCPIHRWTDNYCMDCWDADHFTQDGTITELSAEESICNFRDCEAEDKLEYCASCSSFYCPEHIHPRYTSMCVKCAQQLHGG